MTVSKIMYKVSSIVTFILVRFFAIEAKLIKVRQKRMKENPICCRINARYIKQRKIAPFLFIDLLEVIMYQTVNEEIST